MNHWGMRVAPNSAAVAACQIRANFVNLRRRRRFLVAESFHNIRQYNCVRKSTVDNQRKSLFSVAWWKREGSSKEKRFNLQASNSARREISLCPACTVFLQHKKIWKPYRLQRIPSASKILLSYNPRNEKRSQVLNREKIPRAESRWTNLKHQITPNK